MNNGNFFPNMEQNQNPQGGATTLNSMNMQSMQQATTQPQNITPPPITIEANETGQNPIPDFSIQSENNMAAPPQDQPLFGAAEPTAAPQIVNDPPQMPEPTIPTIESPTIEEPAPETTPNIEPTITEQPVPIVNITNSAPEEKPMDTPLFNNNDSIVKPSEPIYDVPVTAPEENKVEESKATQVEELLNSNGIVYKSYSNETGHCIIIEL